LKIDPSSTLGQNPSFERLPRLVNKDIVVYDLGICFSERRKIMSESEKVPAWVYVVVEKIGQDENVFALTDPDKDQRFIPVFESQEDGSVCMRSFEKKPGAEYELEAIRLPVLAQTARENRMDIYFLDFQGRIMERLTPSPDA
jgi:hypothetical protein